MTFLIIYIYIYIYCNQIETQTLLSCHYKFISLENITILPISSDDFLHALLEVAEQQMWSYSSYLENKRN